MNNQKVFLICIFCILFSNVKIFADLEDTKRNQIPVSYYSSCEKQGTTILYKYVSNHRARTAVVYLPYGYDENDFETTYPVLFLMHGGGGTSTSYLGTPGSPNQLCWIIDNAIENEQIQPLIIVCPNDNGAFYNELRKSLIPAIDKDFNTKADRNNRAFGGFSMGSVATWNVFLHDLDLVANFIPMSGDSWVCGNTGGKNYPEQTAIALSNADFLTDYKDSYYIFSATGTGDTAYPNLVPQINAMKKLTDSFKYTNDDFTNGNLMFYVVKGNIHSYNHTYEYIYNALHHFYGRKNAQS
ncbi:MAG: hypothetical protein MJ188_05600 [Treponema sp.]|nr:hypothetical protein [Treponema sp.]